MARSRGGRLRRSSPPSANARLRTASATLSRVAGLTVVSGAPGSGKTELLVRDASRRYEADRFASTLVLVPTVRHADQFRRRLAACCGVAVNLDVATLSQFARRYVDAGIPTIDVVQELLQRVTREQIEGGAASRFAPIAGVPGLHTLVGRAVAELVIACVAPTEIEAAAAKADSPDHIALAAIYRAYRGLLEARGWRDPREAPSLAAEAVRRAADIPGRVLVDSFEFLNPREIMLMLALAERTEVAVALDSEGSERARWTAARLDVLASGVERVELPARPVERRTTARTAFDAETQLRGIARAIKQTLAHDPALRPSDCAVVFRRATPHLALARRVFAEYELPFDPAAGEPLAARPFGAWVLSLLRLPAHGWRLTRLAELLRSAFLDRRRWDIGDGDIDLVLRAGRSHRLLSGLDDLRKLPDALRKDAEESAGSDRDGYAARLHAAAGAVARATDGLCVLLDVEEPRTAGAWAEALDGALFGPAGLVSPGVDRYEGFEVETAALRADLDTLRVLAETLGSEPVPLEMFAEELDRRMQRSATLVREAGGVLFAPMHTLHGLRFAHVFVGGLAEGEFPAPRRAAALLDRQGREALRMGGLDLPPEPRATEDELWTSASSRADVRVELWRPRFDDAGRPLVASWYFSEPSEEEQGIGEDVAPEDAASLRELAVSLSSCWKEGEQRRPAGFAAWPLVVRAAAPVEQRRRSFAGAGAYEGDLAGASLEWLTGEDTAWSVSRLETYRTCAFQFFGRYTLGLSPVRDESAEADAALRGSVVHEILEDALAPLAQEGRPLVSATVEAAVRRMRERGREIWRSAPDRLAFGRAALWRFQWDEAAGDLDRLLHAEARRNEELGVERVAGLEQEFETALSRVEPAFRLRGNIDRVDAGRGFVQIVDYKSGREITRKQVESGDRLQLQLYTLAVRAQTGAGRLIARYAYLNQRARDWSLDTANGEDAALIDAVAGYAEAVRTAVAAGDFRVNPQVTPCPRYCDFRHICRVTPQYSRSKRWS